MDVRIRPATGVMQLRDEAGRLRSRHDTLHERVVLGIDNGGVVYAPLHVHASPCSIRRCSERARDSLAHRIGALGRKRAAFAGNHARLGNHVGGPSPANDAHVGGRILVKAPERHVCDGVGGHEDCRNPALGLNPRVRRHAMEGGFEGVMAGRPLDDGACRAVGVEHIAGRA